jgi:hypothetical protein
MVLVTESGMDQHSDTANQSIEDTKETVEDAGDAVERRRGTGRDQLRFENEYKAQDDFNLQPVCNMRIGTVAAIRFQGWMLDARRYHIS